MDFQRYDKLSLRDSPDVTTRALSVGGRWAVFCERASDEDGDCEDSLHGDRRGRRWPLFRPLGLIYPTHLNTGEKEGEQQNNKYM